VSGKGFLRFRTEAEAEGGLVVFVADLGEKDALLAANPAAFFTTPHYDDWAIILVDVPAVDVAELTELIAESWRLKAPPKLVRELRSPER
jgi:hypothetical protein